MNTPPPPPDAPLPLPIPEQPNPPPRPSMADSSVIDAAVRALLPAVLGWLETDVPKEPDKREAFESEVIDDLKKAWDSDAYNMAKNLDDHCGWVGCNAELVEAVEAALHHLYDAHKAAVKEWVAANGIRPRVKVGDIVVTPHGTGDITAIREDTAEYIVMTEEHAARWGRQSRCGVVVAFEQCHQYQAGRIRDSVGEFAHNGS